MRPIPIVFGRCTGWFHPSPAPGGRCVVLCGADGYDGLCSHRPWRELALRLAAAGLPVLRFDPPGSGDSGGPDEAAPDMNNWATSVVEAAAEARRLTGASEVSLVGLRLGAAAVALAASRLEPTPIALLFPVLSGRAHARTLRVLATPTEEGPEIAGYPWSEEAIAAVALLDPAGALRAAAPRRILLLPRPEALTAAQAVAASLPEARAVAAEGYGALFAEAHAAAAPDAAYDAILAFLSADAPAAPARVPAHPAPGVLHLEGGVTERAVRFGRDGGLVGAWTEPAGGARPGSPAVLIPNIGASHHTGNGRLLLAMARRAAATGWPVLRYDATGVGESENPRGLPLVRLVYSPTALEDARAALDWMEARGHSQHVATGLCAGGWTALHLAFSDHRVVQVLPINIQAFVWRPGRVLTVPTRRAQEIVSKRGLRWELLAQAWRNGADWPELIRVLLPGVLGRAWRRTVRRLAASLGLYAPAALLPWTGPGRVVGWVRHLAKRGVRVTFAYSEEDPGINDLEVYFGHRGRHLSAITGVEPLFLKGADHVLSTRTVRRAWIERFLELIGAPQRSAGQGPEPRPGASKTTLLASMS